MLTDPKCRNAKRRDKTYKLFDAKGLFLIIAPAGGKWWRFKYSFEGKAKLLSLGTYPLTALKEARERRDTLKKQLASGIDPSATRKAAKHLAADTFAVLALEWHGKQSAKWDPGHAARVMKRLQNILAWIGDRPVREITAPELLALLRSIESRGALESAHRAHQTLSQVMRYGIATGRAERDPAADLKGALSAARVTNRAAITEPKKVGELLRALEGYQGSFVTRCALQLAPLVFVRPGELRRAEWVEIDFDTATWRIPGSKMKMRTDHIVPLSSQAVAALRDLHQLTGGGRYVFPGERTHSRPMSENTVNAALRRLGYTKSEMTGHGFRALASTLLNEQGWPRDVIERQLAHVERNRVRAAYNRAEHLPERRRMMQGWADYLDALCCGGNVVSIRA